MSTAGNPRRLLRRIGAVLAGLLASIARSTLTDTALHATVDEHHLIDPRDRRVDMLLESKPSSTARVGGSAAASPGPSREGAKVFLAGRTRKTLEGWQR